MLSRQWFRSFILISAAHPGIRRAAVPGKGNDFYQDCIAAAPPSFPRQIPGGVEALILFLGESEHRHLFSPWLLLPPQCAVLLVASHFSFQGLCHSAVASQHRKVTIPRAEKIGREKSPSISFWVTKVCVRNPPMDGCMEQGQILVKRSFQMGWSGKCIN